MACVYVSKNSRGNIDFWLQQPTKSRELDEWDGKRYTEFEGEEMPYSGHSCDHEILGRLVKGLNLRRGQCKCVHLCEDNRCSL